MSKDKTKQLSTKSEKISSKLVDNTPYIEEFKKKDGIEMRLFVDLMIANQGNKEVVKERLDELLAFLTKTIEGEREKYLKGFIKLGYGKRCKEYEEGCPTCDEWKLFDEYINKLKKKG